MSARPTDTEVTPEERRERHAQAVRYGTRRRASRCDRNLRATYLAMDLDEDPLTIFDEELGRGW